MIRPCQAVFAGLTALTLVASGCAGLVSPGGAGLHAVDLDRPEMQQFSVASMTQLERDVRIETGDRDRPKLTPALFWTGIIVGTAGAVGSVSFGVAGFVTKNQLKTGYQDDGLTVEDRDALVNRGEAFNTAAMATAAAAVLGYALSIVTYGVDWNRCGPLVHKRRRCKELGL
ncbi:hypothetical protein [Enhygromyxa salina]|uniref:Lipoprotein n=1 Tax=Enhygromyxa salina TaxID=215803 RepID=A0A2S9Y7V6_9BACT|nr:hypothetical protein [Enhygromyxa salina]PRQ01194.1 hypothetical protein ENSA7_57990 [Enhygromyxa salina]